MSDTCPLPVERGVQPVPQLRRALDELLAGAADIDASRELGAVG